ncbi:FecR family protein [Steroidobacter flavus]|uniref:FecR family protein n=1 Tax=Steroidobacter flavus TaxID=1842136 RepID=A0ABV8SMV9_9GAMM
MSDHDLIERAARWLDETSQSGSADKQAALARWLEESEAHRQAYEQVKKTWALARQSAHDSQMLALRHETALRITRRSARTTARQGWLAAGVACLVIGAAVLLGMSPQLTSQTNALLASFGIARDGTYVTGVGERLVINLKDGSQVTLNTGSSVEVAFSATERGLRLLRGQALFEVAKDPARPFVVTANDRRLVAVGTAFDVRLDGARMQVTMVEGTIRVERVARVSSAPATITAGEQLTVDAAQLDRIRTADPERTTSWQHGQLLFDNTRLADAIAEMNRYSDRQLELGDASLADLRISGAFSTSRPAVFVEALTMYFPISVDHADEQKLTLIGRSSSATP